MKEMSLHIATCYFGAELFFDKSVMAVSMDYFRVPPSLCKPPSSTDEIKDTIKTSSVPRWIWARVSALALRELHTLAVARSFVIAITGIVASRRVRTCRLTLADSLETRGPRREKHSWSYAELDFGVIIHGGNVYSFVG
jgi:hypothetical protein